MDITSPASLLSQLVHSGATSYGRLAELYSCDYILHRGAYYGHAQAKGGKVEANAHL